MARKSLMHNYIYFETLEAGPHRKIAGRTALEQASRRRCRTRARSAPNNSASAARELTLIFYSTNLQVIERAA